MVWNPRNWYRYMFPTIRSLWIWPKGKVLPFPILQSGCTIPCGETDVLNACIHIPDRSVWSIDIHLNEKESWWAWFPGLVTMLSILLRTGKHVIFLIFCKFFAEIVCQTINFSNFILGEHSGNGLNVIIEHYKFNKIIAILLISNELFFYFISNSR